MPPQLTKTFGDSRFLNLYNNPCYSLMSMDFGRKDSESKFDNETRDSTTRMQPRLGPTNTVPELQSKLASNSRNHQRKLDHYLGENQDSRGSENGRDYQHQHTKEHQEQHYEMYGRPPDNREGDYRVSDKQQLNNSERQSKTSNLNRRNSSGGCSERSGTGGNGGEDSMSKSENDKSDSAWSEILHRQFVEAIYEIGLSHASPAVIMDHMMFVGNATTDDTGAVTSTSVVSSGNSTETNTSGRRNSLRDESPSESVSNRNRGTGGSQENLKDFVNNPVTSERVKSHLQKYRKNKKKSKDEFMHEYDVWMQKALTVSIASSSLPHQNSAIPDSTKSSETLATDSASMVLDLMGVSEGNLLGGELAAFLSYSAILEDRKKDLNTEEKKPLQNTEKSQSGSYHAATEEISCTIEKSTPSRPNMEPNLSLDMEDKDNNVNRKRLHASQLDDEKGSKTIRVTGARIPFPVLTQEERESSLGVSISHVIGLFHSMTNHLMQERDKEKAACEETNGLNVHNEVVGVADALTDKDEEERYLKSMDRASSITMDGQNSFSNIKSSQRSLRTVNTTSQTDVHESGKQHDSVTIPNPCFDYNHNYQQNHLQHDRCGSPADVGAGASVTKAYRHSSRQSEQVPSTYQQEQFRERQHQTHLRPGSSSNVPIHHTYHTHIHRPSNENQGHQYYHQAEASHGGAAAQTQMYKDEDVNVTSVYEAYYSDFEPADPEPPK